MLKADLKTILGERDWHCAANLPYYVTTPILLTLIQSGLPISLFVFMMQKEVADRILAAPGSKDYGALTLAVQFDCTAERVIDIAPTAFQQRVWEALTHIPYGETRSYSEIAEALGAPRAVRAVASACASNPVALAIPCHRVVQKGGALSGYRWGVRRKATLLAAEARHVHDDETESVAEGSAA